MQAGHRLKAWGLARSVVAGLEQTRDRAHRVRMKLVPQFEPQVPSPLRDHLPALLSRGRVAAPAVGVLLDVFI
jgi:hypothetical protein